MENPNAMDLIQTKSFKLAVITRGDKDSKNLAILIPGRLDTKDYANFISHAEYLAYRGFFAVVFDPPGIWGSSGGISIYTTTNYLKAVNELVEYFGNRPTLLLGFSRGGSAAILVSMSNPAVIGIVPIMANYGTPSSPKAETLKVGFEITYKDMPPGIFKTGEQKKFELPISYWEDGKLYNPAKYLEKCTKPKLLIYGTKDEFTSPEKVREIYEKIPGPKMIKEIDSEHEYRLDFKAIEEVNKSIGQFLDNYIT